MGDKVYSFDDYDCFECFQFKCEANSCPHHIGTGFGAIESTPNNQIVGWSAWAVLSNSEIVYILWRAVYPE